MYDFLAYKYPKRVSPDVHKEFLQSRWVPGTSTWHNAFMMVAVTFFMSTGATRPSSSRTRPKGPCARRPSRSSPRATVRHCGVMRVIGVISRAITELSRGFHKVFTGLFVPFVGYAGGLPLPWVQHSRGFIDAVYSPTMHRGGSGCDCPQVHALWGVSATPTNYHHACKRQPPRTNPAENTPYPPPPAPAPPPRPF